ncbi:ATP-binding protein [Arcanobacterium hippocoleae]
MDIQRSTETRKLAKQGLAGSHGSHELESSYSEAVELRNELEQSNEKLFETTIVVGVAGKAVEDLQENVARVRRSCAKHSCDLEVLKYMQKDALNALLPLGRCDLPIHRTLTTAALAVLEPFTTQELFDLSGMFYGVNALSKNLIMLSRSEGMNANAFILGTSGSGKSQFAKFEMMQTFLRRVNDEILIIDPEREYVSLSSALKASRVVISPGSKSALNALEVDKNINLDEDPIRAKCSFVLSICQVLLGGAEGLSNVERSIIDRCAQNVYRIYFNTDNADMPTLMSLYQELKKQPEIEAGQLATGLEIYAKGSAAGFAAQTNVDLSARVVVYDLADLGRDLQTFGMMVVLENVWARICANKARGVRTWLYIDEFHLLFENDFAAAYCQAIYKRVRKYGAAATGITQNIEELLLNDRARLMLSNSDSVFLLNQQSTDAQALQDLLRLSAQQKSFFTNASPGCGLLKSGSTVIPFDNSMDVESSIFQLFQTTFEVKEG